MNHEEDIDIILDRLSEYEDGNAVAENDFGELPPYEQKVFLCNALGVSSYYSNDELREKLEVIINAN